MRRKANACAAIPALEKLGFDPVYWRREQINGRRYEYCIATKDGRELSLKIHARSHRYDGRYPMGITYRLFRTVEYFVFWLEDEPDLLIVPTTILRGSWRGECTNGDQWFVNIVCDYNTCRIEAPEL